MPKAVFVLVVAGILGFFIFQRLATTSQILADTTISGNYSVPGGKTVVFKNGAKLKVLGDVKVAGNLECDSGPLNLEIGGKLTVTGTILCQLPEDVTEGEAPPSGVNLVISGSGNFEKNSLIASNSHIQIVESAEHLLKTKEDLKKAFLEVLEDTIEGPRIGPLLPEVKTPSSGNFLAQFEKNGQEKSNSGAGHGFSFVKNAVANSGKNVKFSGTVSVGDPKKPLPKKLNLKKSPREIDRILVWFYLPNRGVEFTDFEMLTPDGQNGVDVGSGCLVNVPKNETTDDRAGKDALRMRVAAKTIKVANFNLILGDGGRGGNGQTDKNCFPGIAVAGDGGQPANFKWTAVDQIEIFSRFNIRPGKGGAGGKAVAYGGDGDPSCPGKKGGDAAAFGGKGADNKRTLRVAGDVKGLANIFVGSMYGGKGGDGKVDPGKGGDGKDCGCQGGLGGQGVAKGGKGGIFGLTLPLGVGRIEGSEDKNGSDGQGEDKLGQPGLSRPCGKDQAG